MKDANKPTFAELKKSHTKKLKGASKATKGTVGGTTTDEQKGYDWEWPPEVLAFLNATVAKCLTLNKSDANGHKRTSIDKILEDFSNVLPNHGEARQRGDRFIRNALARVVKSEKSLADTGSTFRKDRSQNAADLWAEQQDIKSAIRKAAGDELDGMGLKGQAANKARPGWIAKKKALMWKAYAEKEPEGAKGWKERAVVLAQTEATTLKDSITSNQSKLRATLDKYLSKLDGDGMKQVGPMTSVTAYGFIDVTTGKTKTVVIASGRDTPSGLSFPEFMKGSIHDTTSTGQRKNDYDIFKENFAKFTSCALKPLAKDFLSKILPEDVDAEDDVIDVDALEGVPDDGPADEAQSASDQDDEATTLFPTESIIIDDDNVDSDSNTPVPTSEPSNTNKCNEDPTSDVHANANATKATSETTTPTQGADDTGGRERSEVVSGIFANTDMAAAEDVEQRLIDAAVEVAKAIVNTQSNVPTPTPSPGTLSGALDIRMTAETSAEPNEESVIGEGGTKATTKHGRRAARKAPAPGVGGERRGVKRKASQIAEGATAVPALSQVKSLDKTDETAEYGRGKRGRISNRRYEQ